MEKKFKVGKKWFWIGIVIGFFNVVGGFIYGIALLFEDDFREEALIILGWTLMWALAVMLVFLYVVPPQ